jgi:hypothetical protein
MKNKSTKNFTRNFADNINLRTEFAYKSDCHISLQCSYIDIGCMDATQCRVFENTPMTIASGRLAPRNEQQNKVVHAYYIH